MWIFSTGGFISAVSHRDNDKLTMIRARDKLSLEEFLSSVRKGFVEAGKTEAEAIEITEPGKDGMWEIYAVTGDYKWRVVMPKSAFGIGLAYEATHYVNYSNFKSKLTATRGDKWHDACMKVWSAMFAITDKLKTGNPDVDNPKPYSYYHGGDSYANKGSSTYPAPKGKAGLAKSEGDASGSELDWMDDALGSGYYDASVGSEHAGFLAGEVDEGRSYRWGGNGLFNEDLEGYEDPDEADWRKGLHGFNSDSSLDRIDGRGEIVDGQFLGSTFFDADNGDAPTDEELARVEEQIAEAWEEWDATTEFNTITGEHRQKQNDELFDADYKFKSSVHSLTEDEWKQTQLAEGYAEQ